MKTLLAIIVVAALSGCSSVPTEKIRKEVLAFQAMADEIGLEEYDSTWSGNVTTNFLITRENGERVSEFEHKNPWKPRTYFRTRKPITAPPDTD